jgi:penicillin-binding protein 1B
MARRKKRGARRRTKRRLLRYGLYAVGLALVVGVGYGAYLSWVVTAEFDERGWDVPAQVYAAPLEIYGGRRLGADAFVVELERLGYRAAATPLEVGTFRRAGGAVELHTRAFEQEDTHVEARRLRVEFSARGITAVENEAGRVVPIAQLDPLLIGSIFPAHGEDRIIVGPDEVPPLLTESLKAVEDRRFDEHWGVDLRGIARAALVNLANAEIRQGGSTLTQQLVRSYFLTTDRTWTRKLREAFMAVALELHHSKDELMLAYVNEIYLGQDGGRAIHGFGLASRFYFGKPLSELEAHEIALLIAEVRGPSYYDPRRHPDRALARRNLVLDQMLERDLIDAGTDARGKARPLGVVSAESGQTAYYASFLDLVRRQLRRDYADADLQAKGLRVFTTLDPTIQATAEKALVTELDALQPGRPELEGALIVTNPHSAEVRALVGSRRIGYDGFNRALDAKRQVGSLIKPVVYLAALESGRSLATQIEDAPIEIPLDNGTTWSPTNFTDEAHGTVTTIRALAESFNMATVRLGMDVGLKPVVDLLGRLGLERTPPLYPSLLLGALDLTPLEVTQIYNTLANGGFRMPLRAVRAVVDGSGNTLQRYPLEIREAADPATVYALNHALVQVMERGTGRTARQRLPATLVTAGKTGTSDGLRDSWFAGFSNDQLVVTWVGNDANAVTNLTGSTGAARVWARVFAELDATSYAPPPPAGVETAWIDYMTGLGTDASCPDAVKIAVTAGAELPPKAVACGSDKTRIGSRIRQWFRNKLH